MADFDYNTLNSIGDYVGNRAQSLPKDETDFISAIQELSKQEQQTRTVALVAKTAADQQAQTAVTAYHGVDMKLSEANADPFYDLKSFFGKGPSKDDLITEQQKLTHKIQNISATYNSIAQGQEFKRQNIASQMDKLKTIQATKAGNVAQMATLTSLQGQQVQLAQTDLSRLSLQDLEANVRKNSTPYDDGIVEMAYYQRLREQAMATEADAKSKSGKTLTTDEFLNQHLTSAQKGRALVAQAQNSGQDVVQIGNRNMPAGQILEWAEKVEAPINSFMANRDSLYANTLSAERSMQEVENLIHVAFPTQGVELNSLLSIPSVIDSQTQAVEINTRLAEGLLQMPTEVQGDMARLVNLRMTQTQMRNSKQEKTAGSVQMEANLSRAIIDTTAVLKDKMTKYATQKYSENKAAASGVKEVVQFGRVTNPTSATAILAENSFVGTPEAMDSSVLGTYYEGVASIIGDSVQSQYEEMFRSENDATSNAGIDQTNAFAMFLANQRGPQGYRPSDSFIVTNAVRNNAALIKDQVFGKISNIHLAASARMMAEQYASIPEVSNALIQMQDGMNLVGDLARPDVQTPNLIMTTLYKLETSLKASGKLPENADLMIDFVKTAQDRELLDRAVQSVAPREEIGLAIDNLVFGGRAAQLYRNRITQSYFTDQMISNIRNRREEVVQQEKAAENSKGLLGRLFAGSGAN